MGIQTSGKAHHILPGDQWDINQDECATTYSTAPQVPNAFKFDSHNPNLTRTGVNCCTKGGSPGLFAQHEASPQNDMGNGSLDPLARQLRPTPGGPLQQWQTMELDQEAPSGSSQ